MTPPRTIVAGRTEAGEDYSLSRPDPLRGNLADQVYAELRSAICDFRIPPNRRLVQNDLAAEFDISRTPVRDALIQLYQEGLVRPLPDRGGFLVTEFTAGEVLGIYEVRRALEPRAAGQAAGRHAITEVAELRQVNHDLGDPSRRTGGRDEYELNRRFHQVVVGPCQNEILKATLDRLWSMPSSLRMYNRQVGSLSTELIVREHDQIVDALVDGDPEVVIRLVSEHIDGARNQALKQLERPGD